MAHRAKVLNEISKKAEDVQEPIIAQPDGLKGLESPGNLCYINASLKFLYMSLELRDCLAQIDVASLEGAFTPSSLKGHQPSFREDIPAFRQFIVEVIRLFRSMGDATVTTPDSPSTIFVRHSHSIYSRY